jgi:hypothetical protein
MHGMMLWTCNLYHCLGFIMKSVIGLGNIEELNLIIECHLVVVRLRTNCDADAIGVQLIYLYDYAAQILLCSYNSMIFWLMCCLQMRKLGLILRGNYLFSFSCF